MNRVLLDANVLLDVLLDRKPHAEASSAIWAEIETRGLEGLIPAHAVTTIHYLVRKERGASKARQTITDILRVFGVAPVTTEIIQEALQLAWPDFEDAVTAAAARLARCDAIITRDPREFPRSPIRVLSPQAAAALLRKP